MNSILQYRLETSVNPEGVCVLFQVLEQNKFLIPPGKFKLDTGDMKIESAGGPELARDTIFLRGILNSHDYSTAFRLFGSAREAGEYANHVQNSIEFMIDDIKHKITSSQSSDPSNPSDPFIHTYEI